MNQQFKKIFSVAITLIAGLGIILFAWKGDTSTSNKISFEPTVIKNNDWRNSLRVVPQTSPEKILDATKNAGLEATTTSAIMARDMLTGYALLAKRNSTTTVSDADAQALAQEIIKKIDVAQGKQYTKRDLDISTDNSPDAVNVYSKEIARIIQSFIELRTKSDLEIVLSDPRPNPEVKAVEMGGLANRYEKLVDSLVATKVPSEIALIHLRIIQGYSNIGVSLIALADVYTDPMRGLVALTQYRKEIDDFIALSKEYGDYLTKSQQ